MYNRSLLIPLTVLLAAFGCQRDDKANKAGAARSTKTTVAANAPTLEMFVMSQCPYGVQVVNAVAPVAQQLGGAVNLKIGFIGSGQAGSLTSMHGPAEVKGDIAQICAAELAPDRYLDMMVCQNKNMRAVDTNWEACAKEVGMDATALGQCVNGDQGQALLAASFADAAQRGATGSPTIFLNGQPYQGGRKSRDFLKALCAAQTGEAPEACKNIPVPPEVHAIFLSDKRCKECDITALEPRLKNELGGLQVKHVDYMTEEGKALYAELTAASPDFKTLPAVLLEADVEKDQDGYPALKQFLRPLGKYRELRLGGQFDPRAEICDNGTDDDNDSKVDCADDGCAAALTCRKAIPKTLDAFVMSQCPYGAKALIALKDVADHFGKDIKVNVRFIGDVANGQLTSMHGQSEVDEDIRERCAIEKYGKNHQALSYLACRSQDYNNPEWKPCATSSGMDPAVIQACFDGNGKDLLRKEFELAKSLGIGASPTFLANNKREFNAIAAGEIQKQFCQDNPDLAGCKTPVQSATDAPGATPPAGACE